VVYESSATVARGASGREKKRAGKHRRTGYWRHDKRARWGSSERRRKEVCASLHCLSCVCLRKGVYHVGGGRLRLATSSSGLQSESLHIP